MESSRFRFSPAPSSVKGRCRTQRASYASMRLMEELCQLWPTDTLKQVWGCSNLCRLAVPLWTICQLKWWSATALHPDPNTTVWGGQSVQERRAPQGSWILSHLALAAWYKVTGTVGQNLVRNSKNNLTVSWYTLKSSIAITTFKGCEKIHIPEWRS